MEIIGFKKWIEALANYFLKNFFKITNAISNYNHRFDGKKFRGNN